MSILIDTSVWVRHFKQNDSQVVLLAATDQVLTHSLVLGELACGTPPERKRTLADFALLSKAKEASLEEVVYFIEAEKLYGKGCGFIDLSLLASTLVTPSAKLWTLDKRLAQLAYRFGVAYQLDEH